MLSECQWITYRKPSTLALRLYNRTKTTGSSGGGGAAANPPTIRFTRFRAFELTTIAQTVNAISIIVWNRILIADLVTIHTEEFQLKCILFYVNVLRYVFYLNALWLLLKHYTYTNIHSAKHYNVVKAYHAFKGSSMILHNDKLLLKIVYLYLTVTTYSSGCCFAKKDAEPHFIGKKYLSERFFFV